MFIDLSNVKIFLRPGKTDLRKGVSGLVAIAQDDMAQDPFSGSVYLFCNKNRKLLKAVYWDKTGFWLSQKRLEKDTYPWPQDATAARELTGAELQMLLTGIDFFRKHQERYFEKAS